MLTRLYVDNFRCLVNFELKLDRLNLLLGENGSGKTTVFDVLRRLQGFVVGRHDVATAFSTNHLTRWSQSNVQKFQLNLQVDDSVYAYSLEIKHDRNSRSQEVTHEKLLRDDDLLLETRIHKGYVHADHGPGWEVRPGNVGLSNIFFLKGRPELKRLTRFHECIAGMMVLRPLPAMMGSESNAKESWLAPDACNFASWLRYLKKDHPENIKELEQQLCEVIPGFDAFSPQKAGEDTEVLKVLLRNAEDDKSLPYNFSELSDGQRQLILLYSLLYGVKGEGYCLFLDEPDNYVALREIQPWLMALHDACGNEISQAVLISHHPEIMDYLASSAGRWFERQDDGRVQVQDAPQPVGGLKISETVARGWNQ